MRKIFFLFLLSSYVFAQLPEINVPYKRYVLKNGLNVLLHEDHTLPLISVNTWYHVGSGNEKKGGDGGRASARAAFMSFLTQPCAARHRGALQAPAAAGRSHRRDWNAVP